MNKTFIIFFFSLGIKALAEYKQDCQDVFNPQEMINLNKKVGKKRSFYTLEEGKEFFKRKGFESASEFQRLQKEARDRVNDGEARPGDEEFLRIPSRGGIDAKWKLKEKGIQFASLFPGIKKEFYTLEEGKEFFKRKGFKNAYHFRRLQKEARDRVNDGEAMPGDEEFLKIPASDFDRHWGLKKKGIKLASLFPGLEKFYTLEEGKEFFKRKGFQSVKEFRSLQKEARDRVNDGEAMPGDEEFLKIPSGGIIHKVWKLKEKGIQFASLLTGIEDFYTFEEGKEFFKRKGFQSVKEFRNLQREARLRLQYKRGRPGDEEFLKIPTGSINQLDKYWGLKKKGIKFASLFPGIKKEFYTLEEGKEFFKRKGFKNAYHFRRLQKEARDRVNDEEARPGDEEFLMIPTSDVERVWKLKEKGITLASLFPGVWSKRTRREKKKI